VVLVILRRTNNALHYCPFLPVVASLLLMYLTREDCLHVLRLMLEDAQRMLNEEGQFNRAEELRGLRWYFPLDKKDYFSTIETFMTFMRDRSKSVKECLTHLESIEVDTRKFMQEQFSSFFLAYVPLDIINTLFTVYINEGIKIMFRIGYAFFKILKPVILDCTNEEEFTFNTKERLEAMDDEEKKKFVNQCFHLRIVKITKQFSLVDTNNEDLNKSYVCDPNIIGDTKILSDEALVNQLYKGVPAIFKANDLRLIFSTWADGYSLAHMCNVAAVYKEDAAVFLLLVQDHEDNAFGAFLQHEISKTGPNKKLGSAENFVFTLKPQVNFYASAPQAKTFFEYDGNNMYIGAGEKGCALVIDSSLEEGFSGESSTFCSPPLTQTKKGKDFRIKYLELMVFV